MSQLLECFIVDYYANTLQCSGVLLQKKPWLTFKMCQTSAYWKKILSLLFCDFEFFSFFQMQYFINHLHVFHQGCTNPGHLLAWASIFYMAAPNTFSKIIAIFSYIQKYYQLKCTKHNGSLQNCQSPAWNLLCHLPVLRIWWRLLDFLKIGIIVLKFHTN